MIAASAFVCLGAGKVSADENPRVAVLDWGLAETMLMLGSAPFAVAEAPLYGQRVVVPPLPEGTIDLGLRSWPNIEFMQSLRPDLILCQAGYGIPASRLEQIAPTLALPLYTAERQPLQRSEEALHTIGARLGRSQAAELALESSRTHFSTLRDALTDYDGRPVLIVKFADERLIDIYGAGSLFDDVLGLVGIENAWTGTTNNWGFTTDGIDAIARFPHARLVIIEPGPPQSLQDSALWNALAAVREKRVISIPPTWVFGALPSAMRFGTVLARGLMTA